MQADPLRHRSPETSGAPDRAHGMPGRRRSAVGGRLRLSVGDGWVHVEYEALGQD